MRQCSMCQKGSQMGGERRLLRGHYNPVNWSRKHANLQLVRTDGKRILICTGCIRTLHKAPRAPHGKKAIAAAAAATAK
jgi:ribosomal protein L28